MAVGSAGGAQIINHVARVLIAVLAESCDIQSAINMPNVGSRNGPTELESGRLDAGQQQQLKLLGHDLVQAPITSGLHGIVRECRRSRQTTSCTLSGGGRSASRGPGSGRLTGSVHDRISAPQKQRDDAGTTQVQRRNTQGPPTDNAETGTTQATLKEHKVNQPGADMERKKLNSSLLKSAGYDASAQRLELEYASWRASSIQGSTRRSVSTSGRGAQSGRLLRRPDCRGNTPGKKRPNSTNTSARSRLDSLFGPPDS